MFDRIAALLYKDCCESLRNRIMLVAVILPLAASLVFTILSAGENVPHTFEVGVSVSLPELASFIEEYVDHFHVQTVEDAAMGKELVKKGQLDAVITTDSSGANVSEDGSAADKSRSYTVYINNSRPVQYFMLKDNFRALIEMYLGIEPTFAYETVPVRVVGADLSVLPVWITVTMALIGVMVLSGNMAEERENQSMDGILITPMTESEILLSKLLFGFLLQMGTTIFMILLHDPGMLFKAGSTTLIFLIALGALCFTLVGLCIGIMVDSQATARAYGTIIYFPLLLPAFIYEFSPVVELFARFLPTYYFYTGLEQVLLYHSGGREIKSQFFFLLLFSGVLALMAKLASRRLRL